MDTFMVESGDLAAIKILRFVFLAEAATFQYHDALPSTRQLDGEDNARRARADNANIGAWYFRARALFEIANQETFP
jgi:hypothetical protein